MNHTLHVSPSGADTAPGTASRPVGSLSRAVELSRAFAAGAPRRIIVHGGEYFAASAALGPQDSGLSIEAAEGERPILYGGSLVRGWTAEGNGWISARVPGVAEGLRDFRSLVVDGEFRPRARLPETGWFRCEEVFDVPWLSSTDGGWKRKPTEDELTRMTWRGNDLGPWLEPRNAEITVYHQWDESLVGVRRIEAAKRLITFSSPSGHPPGAFPHNPKAGAYVVWNVREGMTRPGQWYLDRVRGRIVYWPLPGETPESMVALAPSVFTILSVAGGSGGSARDITVRGLAMRATNAPLGAAGFGAHNLPGAIQLEGAVENVLLSDLDLRCTGGHAVRVAGTRDRPIRLVRLERSRISESGGAAVQMHGGTQNAVTDTVVRGVGRLYPSALGVTVAGPRCLIAHNDVADTPYTALHGGGEDSVFEYNVMRDFMKELDDGAAIYVFGAKRTVYRSNIAIGRTGRLAHAYYLDEQCDECLVEGNLALNTGWPSHNHMARNCTIRNNIFVDEGDSRLTFPRCEGFTFERNIVRAVGDIRLSGTNALRSMPANVFWSERGTVEGQPLNGYSGGGFTPLEMREGSVLADPAFVDAAGGDFRLRTFSPAAALGFAPLDTDKAGVRQA